MSQLVIVPPVLGGTPTQGRMQVGTAFALPATSTWAKVTGFIASASPYAETTTIVSDCLIVPASGSYTLTAGGVFATGLGTQIVRVVDQNGTILAADASGDTPSVTPTVTITASAGDQLHLEGYASSSFYKTISANVNSFVQIVPV